MDEYPGVNAARSRNARGQGSRLRHELLEAALRVLERSVSADLSLQAVAQEAGVTRQAVYAHFAGRQDLVHEVTRLCWLQVTQEMARGSRRAGAKPAFDRVGAQLRAYVRYAMKNPARSRVLLLGPRPDLGGPGQVRVRAAEPAVLELLRDVEAMYGEQRRLPRLGALDATIMLLSFVHGRVALAQAEPEGRGDSARSLELYVAQVLGDVFRAA